MNKLTLTTAQIRPGIVIQRDAGPAFYSVHEVALAVLFWLALLLHRLTVDTIAAGWLLCRLVWANVAYHIWLAAVGVQVVRGAI